MEGHLAKENKANRLSIYEQTDTEEFLPKKMRGRERKRKSDNAYSQPDY